MWIYQAAENKVLQLLSIGKNLSVELLKSKA